MTMDVAAVGLLAVASIFPVVLLPLVAAFAGRVVLTAYRRRANLAGPLPLDLSLFLRVALLLVLADVATWLGALAVAGPRGRP